MNIRPFLHQKAQIRVDKVGRAGAPVIVIDNFLLDADRMVDYAATEARFGPAAALYPGIQAPIPSPYPLFAHFFTRTLIPENFGLGALDVVDCRSNFSLMLKSADQVGVRQRLPHMDLVEPNHIVLLHYLFDDASGGTSFYRHRATGFEIMEKPEREIYEAALKEEIARHPQSDYIHGDTEIFERIAGYEAVFNRAIIYRSNCLHAAMVQPGFVGSDDPRTGRLTANTTFFYADPVGFFGEGYYRGRGQ
jgi:hypothetical protein